MKAIVIRKNTDWKTVQLEETEIPGIKPNEVLVKIKASGVNPADWKIIEYKSFDRMKIKLPYTPGSDIAGIIEQAGDNVKRFKTGDEIFGALELAKQGAFAEYAVIDHNLIARKPRNLSFIEAAGVPLASLTAWQALYVKLNLQPNEKVLIQAAAGGVGVFAVQLAKIIGSYIVAVGSEKNKEFLKSIGADEVCDYKNGYTGLPADFDAVLDSVQSSQQTIPLLKKGGRYVSITAPAQEELVKKFEVSATNFLYTSDGKQLNAIKELIESSKLKVFVDKTYPLSEVREALKYQQGSHSRRKNVLKIDPN